MAPIRSLFSERDHVGREHVDRDYVAQYDRKAAFRPDEDVAILHAFGLAPTSSVVDLGAGTGTFAIAIAGECQRVVAVDPSPVMLARARERASQLDADNVEFVEAGFLTYEHRGPPANFVYSRHALHHLPDLWKVLALRRVRDILTDDGVFLLRDVIFSFEAREAEPRLAAWLDAAPLDPASGWTRAELETHLGEEYSTFSWLLEPMLERAGFEIRTASQSVLGTHARYVCVKK